MKNSAHVIIIGAGAAGVAAAQNFSQQGLDYKIIEARTRIGGRILSHVEQDIAHPIELGAEFIHGAPKRILNLMQKMHFPFYDVRDVHYFFRDSKLIKIKGYWEKIETILQQLHAYKKNDRSIEEFIRRQKKIDPLMKKNFLTYVEGFHAADPRLAGEKGLASIKTEEDDMLNENILFRPLLRYDQLLTKIHDSYIDSDRVHLGTVVKKISWRKNQVTLKCAEGPLQRPQTYECEKLVISVPIGVLASDAIEWDPYPKNFLDILHGINMGHVQRIVFRFRERFWEKLHRKSISFFHCGPDHYFPTWWNQQPLRSPYLTAWQGGPKAQQMASWSESERIYTAIKTLSHISGLSINAINDLIQSWHTHNWSADLFSRGAYSYVALDGLAKANRLKNSFEKTIYVIGEATATDSSRGTVHGAFESGWKLKI